MRYFFSTGEASGEMSATLLSAAVLRADPDARFEGIGGERMRASGFTLWTNTRGWGSMGPLEALAKIPKLYAIMWMTALRLVRRPPDLIVLVDFGAFNLRLAKTLRMLRYGGPILYFFPPGAWLDKPHQARAVVRWTVPLVGFEHQRDFYHAVGLPVQYFGHPIAPAYVTRAPRPVPAADGGVVALLPGSREAELRYHLPVLLEALRLVRQTRPQLHAVVGAADDTAEAAVRAAAAASGVAGIQIVRSARAALEGADAAWVASGTAVLEAALIGVPSVALYVLSEAQARIARRVYQGPFITIPNLVLRRRVVPELLQEEATPQALASEMESLLHDPSLQLADLAQLRTALGSPGALEDAATFAVELARS